MIDLNKPIDNTDRKFGSVNEYFITPVKLQSGELTYGLLTEREVLASVKRAENNVEDIIPVVATPFARFMAWLSSFFGPSTRQ
jgi:hypothetical protein